MKFGPVKTPEALGSILAHSLKGPGVSLRKGIVLEAEQIAMLTQAGITDVTAARLDPEDLHEDVAALTLAQALVPDPEAVGLRLTKPFTGRVNIVAEKNGVVQLDAARLVAMNAIDPMITLATVQPYQQMATGGMVGTVKIISYGVPKAHVEHACELGANSLRLCPTQFATVGLILTDTPGGPGDKGKKAVIDRVEALGMRLVETRAVDHDAASIATALGEIAGDLVLILTASATSDAYDVAPQALRDAGGGVTRFGMPVDPGNLLFLGALQTRPVIGLPGCARSPALNGVDWVLSRVACGVEVTSADIAAMGVGGLLKEIPTRPMPRAGRRKAKDI